LITADAGAELKIFLPPTPARQLRRTKRFDTVRPLLIHAHECRVGIGLKFNILHLARSKIGNESSISPFTPNPPGDHNNDDHQQNHRRESPEQTPARTFFDSVGFFQRVSPGLPIADPGTNLAATHDGWLLC